MMMSLILVDENEGSIRLQQVISRSYKEMREVKRYVKIIICTKKSQQYSKANKFKIPLVFTMLFIVSHIIMKLYF